ncbi:hypothetical protein GCM10027085_22780 [Spirosoma aerophilum]
MPDSITGRFTFQPTIAAELNQYSFQVFAHQGLPGDSVLVAFRDSIVCGDVFLVMGQSNAIGRFDDKSPPDVFSRTFGVNNGNQNYNAADTVWCLTNTSEGLNCLWSVELQRYIREQHKIPTAVINGAVGGTDINSHAYRDASQPASLNNLYGRLLYRVTKAGVASQVKAIIWRQGEAEAANDPSNYERVFPQLYKNWKKDYPGLKKIYHSQINLLTNNVVTAGTLRDFQRRSKKLFPDNEPIATVGLAGYQGLHYDEAGYRQFGLELYRLVAGDLYQSADTSNIRSPNIQRVFFSTPEQNEITLEFEPGQEMKWPADTIILNPATGIRYTQRLSDFFYTDYPTGESGLIKSVTEQKNRLILKLTKSVPASTLTYLPSSYTDKEAGFYVGPVIRNRRGMRALTFYKVPIAASLPTAANVWAASKDTTAIRLSWNSKSDSVTQWVIERADTSGQFKLIATVPGSVNSFEDVRMAKPTETLALGKLYEYRLRALGRQAESIYSDIVKASLQPILPVKEKPELELVNTGLLVNPGALVFPNPASNLVNVRLPLDWSGDAVWFKLTSENGTVVLQRTSQIPASTPYLTFSVASIPTGTYMLTMQYQSSRLQCRLLIMQ